MCRDRRLVTLCRHQTTPTVPRAPVTPRGSLTQWPLGDPGPDPKPCEPAQVPPPEAAGGTFPRQPHKVVSEVELLSVL